MTGTLILCATPIGNLDDVSKRLIDALSSADVVYAEDTRRTAKLLNHLGLSRPMTSFFVGNEVSRLDDLRRDLGEGKTVALVTDAGTPVVSDPGASAVDVAISAGASVTAVPGPSAVTLALSLSGFGADRFVFAGFLPRKGDDRSAAIASIAAEERTSVFFAAPSRVASDLEDLASAAGSERRVALCRELTKVHEEVFRSTVGDAAAEFSDPSRARGEFTIVVEGAPPATPDLGAAVAAAEALVTEGVSTKDAAADAAAAFGVSRREVYEALLRKRS